MKNLKNKTLLVVGASGLIGSAAIRQFSCLADWRVLGASRRRPLIDADYEFIPLDLEDRESVNIAAAKISDVTHIIYAALFEMPDLVAGWRSERQMQTNQRMLENLFESCIKKLKGLEQVILLQGGKAYGGHLGEASVPARENTQRVEHANFYWLQEDYLRSLQSQFDWGLTIFRPQIVFGDALGVAMNLVPAIGVYGALLKEQGQRLDYPGGPSAILEAVDADLLARAFLWSTESARAVNETFNLTNGDVFVWENIWSTIADSLGMEVGENKPCSLARVLPRREGEWAGIVSKYSLSAPHMMSFVGKGFQYADVLFATDAEQAPPAKLLSTIKIRQAGFVECMDTEEMLHKWFSIFQQRGLIPPV